MTVLYYGMKWIKRPAVVDVHGRPVWCLGVFARIPAPDIADMVGPFVGRPSRSGACWYRWIDENAALRMMSMS